MLTSQGFTLSEALTNEQSNFNSDLTSFENLLGLFALLK